MTNKIEINGNEYVFQCSYASTRNGFKHICILRRNGVIIGENKACYLNRTWEKYPYQSVMKHAVWIERERFIAYGIERFKEAENKTRLNKKERERVTSVIMDFEPYKELVQVYEKL